MSVERPLAWTVALAAVAVLVVGARSPPAPSPQFVVAALGVLVALPLSVVFLGWLLGVRGTRGRA